MNDKDVLYRYLQQNKHMALATVTATGRPEVATVEYLLDGEDLLMSTYVQYRKYQNLLSDGHIAAVITTGHEKTLQLEGIASELENEAVAEAKSKLLNFEPDFAAYFDENTRFFQIRLTWMRLRDYTQESLQITEVTF